MKHLSISVIGLGYIGLPTALLLAQNDNHSVYGMDVDLDKIKLLSQAKLPFEEQGLQKLFDQINQNKNFSVDSKLHRADVYIIAVPTPNKAGSSDLKYVHAAFQSIKRIAKDTDIIVLESTVAPEDCLKLEKELAKWDKKVYFVHCPERAIPGKTIQEMCSNTRIIGAREKSTKLTIEKMYRSFVTQEIKHTDPVTAACVKLMENTYRAVNIALANEFASIAEELNIDVWEAINLANAHPRVGIHSPGPGVGGHCIPIDPWFFVDSHPNTDVIATSLKRNQQMPDLVVKHFKKYIKKITSPIESVAVLGVSYKKDVDDWRESPAISIQKLLEKDFKVLASDPHVKKYYFDLYSIEETLSSVDAVIVVTDHTLYKNINFKEYSNIHLVYDTRNCISNKQCNRDALRILGVG